MKQGTISVVQPFTTVKGTKGWNIEFKEGEKTKTFKPDIAMSAMELVGKTVDYEVETTPNNNPNYPPNIWLSSVTVNSKPIPDRSLNKDLQIATLAIFKSVASQVVYLVGSNPTPEAVHSMHVRLTKMGLDFYLTGEVSAEALTDYPDVNKLNHISDLEDDIPF